MSEIIRVDEDPQDLVAISFSKKKSTKKVLEEDEYLSRMTQIVRRDFFSDTTYSSQSDEPPTTCRNSSRSNRTMYATPASDRTQLSSSSTLRSRRESCAMRLNNFLEKYTSEDNAYFEKIQQKELRRHRIKYPWLYHDKSGNNKRVLDQMNLPSLQEQASLNSNVAMVGWIHQPKNSLFYAPEDQDIISNSLSTVNYNSKKYLNEQVFREPRPTESAPRQRSSRRFCDKIGIDGKLLDGSETPMVNGYSLIPPPESPPTKIVKNEPNKFFIPVESPRDELAHRVYQEKVAKSIRTPSTTRTLNLKTPSSRRGFTDFSFSPGRVKNTTPSHRRTNR